MQCNVMYMAEGIYILQTYSSSFRLLNITSVKYICQCDCLCVFHKSHSVMNYSNIPFAPFNFFLSKIREDTLNSRYTALSTISATC